MPKIPSAFGSDFQVTDDQLRDVTDYVCRLIDQAETERDELVSRWTQSTADHDNDPYPFVSKFLDGWVDLPYPFAGPRAAALADFTIDSITAQKPMVTCLLMGAAERQEAREKTVAFAFTKAEVRERLKTIAPSCWITNHGILRLSAGDELSPLRCDPIKPEDFVCAGSGAYGIKDSRLVGHRFYRTRADIKRLQLAERYSDKVDADSLTSREGVSGSASSDDDLIELYQVYPWLDIRSWDYAASAPEVTKKEGRFSMVVSNTDKACLFVAEYEFNTPCYFNFGYKAAPPVGFWTEKALGYDMQGPHRAYQCMRNLSAAGTGLTAIPPLVGQGGAFARDQRYGMGQFVDMESGSLGPPIHRFDAGTMQVEIQQIERDGDAVARINSAGIGQESTQNKTATQSNNEAAGMRAGIGGYLQTFSAPIAEMCEHAEEILAATFNEWKSVFGDQMPVQSPDEFMVPAIWDVPGNIPNLNPQIVIQNIQLLMQLVEKIFGMAAQAGPQLAASMMAWGIQLLQTAMNAMDFPNQEQILQPLEAMIGGQQQQPEVPGMGGELNGQPGMADVLALLEGSAGQPGTVMPPAQAYG